MPVKEKISAPRRKEPGDLEQLIVHPGLCAHCRHSSLLRSSRSVFVRCGKFAGDGLFARYPAIPVKACTGFAE